MKLMSCFYVLFIATTLGISLSSAETNDKSPDREPFHIAKTDAEKALDDILRRADKDGNMLEYVLGTSGYNAKIDPGYSRLFSINLLRAVAKAESDVVKRYCDGKYRDDDFCGLDYNPISCIQDSSEEGYRYKTTEDDSHKAIIFYQWVGYDPNKARVFYRLIKDGGLWKLDGIDCGNGAKFNMD